MLTGKAAIVFSGTAYSSHESSDGLIVDHRALIKQQKAEQGMLGGMMPYCLAQMCAQSPLAAAFSAAASPFFSVLPLPLVGLGLALLVERVSVT